MIMECTERYTIPQRQCQHLDKTRCTSSPINGSKFCSKHTLQTSVAQVPTPQQQSQQQPHIPTSGPQCTVLIRGQQCKSKTPALDQRTYTAAHVTSKANRKRRRTEAPVHKELVNKTPPLALHAFQIITQERQRLKFKPHIYKRPLEHLKWVIKRERLSRNPIYPSGMEEDCGEYDMPHTLTTLDTAVELDEDRMSDVTERSIYLAEEEHRLQQRLDSLICEVNSYKRSHTANNIHTKATIEAARANVAKTTHLIQGQTSDPDMCACELPNKATKYTCSMCPNRAVPFSKYCKLHILRDPKQLLFSRCATPGQGVTCPAPTALQQPCYLHSLLKRYAVTEVQEIETESSSDSESEAEDSVFEASFVASPLQSPRVPPKKRISSPPYPNPIDQNLENDIDMLPVQPDTVLDLKAMSWGDTVPVEADIPLSVGCLEPQPIPQPLKRPFTKEEEMHARAMMASTYQYGGGGYYYQPYMHPAQTPAVFIHSYTKEGEPIYGSYPNHDYKSYYTSTPPDSRSATPGDLPGNPAYFHAARGMPPPPGYAPAQMPSPVTNKPSPKGKKKTPSKKKKEASQANKSADANNEEEKGSSVAPANPHSQNRSESPISVASPSTMAALKFKISDNKRDDNTQDTKDTPEEAKPKKSSKSKRGNSKANAKTAQQNVIRPPPSPAASSLPPPHTTLQQNPKVAMNHVKASPMPMNENQHVPPHGMMYNRHLVEPGQMHMAGGYMNPYQQQQHHLYTNQHMMAPGQQQQQQQQQYYLSQQMYLPQQNPMMHHPMQPTPPAHQHMPQQAPSPTPAGGVGTPLQITRTTAMDENKEKHEGGTNEYSDYQKFAMQQRQRQIMIAKSHMAAPYGYPMHNPQMYQQQVPYTPASPKPEKKKKSAGRENKAKDDLVPKAPVKQRTSLNSPSNKELSSLQSLMTTASSGIGKIDGLNDDLPVANSTSTAIQTDNKSRSSKSTPRTKKASKVEEKKQQPQQPQQDQQVDQGQAGGQYGVMNMVPGVHHQAYYSVPHQPYVGPMMMPHKNYNMGFYTNGNPLYFKMQEHGVEGGEVPEPRQIVVNDAALSRSRPSTHLMKNQEWVDKYMSGKKPEDNKGNKSKMNTPRDRKSPQKRNLIFHNTEMSLYSDKLTKQQKERYHRTGCNNNNNATNSAGNTGSGSSKKKPDDKVDPAPPNPLQQTSQVLLQNDTLKLNSQQRYLVQEPPLPHHPNSQEPPLGIATHPTTTCSQLSNKLSKGANNVAPKTVHSQSDSAVT